jgi:poly-gamma-glutamate capsule biosynthesis protein CapA/YwtB (metallophosphatase superfamily)
MINIGIIKRKMGSGGTLRHPLPILCTLLLLLVISCQPEGSTVTLALLGDLMLGRAVNPTSASLSYLIPELKTADLSLANLESPLTNYPYVKNTGTGYNLCTSAARTELLSDWGLNLLFLANNHRLDCSPDMRFETANILAAAGIYPVGPGPEPLYREIRGLKLAFLAFDDILTPVDIGAAAHDIQSSRAKGALVVISIHWGAEYQQDASDRQKTLAQMFADAGAALVIGTHPHVLQPAKWIQTPWGMTLVLYSLGNALFDQGGLADTRQSALVMITLNSEGVQSARAAPFEIDVFRNQIIQPDAQTTRQIHTRLDLP